MFEKLLILRDDPLFSGAEAFEPNKDAFNHEAYAKAILKLINENQPPLSIGLFGPWGIGKSTVIRILFKLIGSSENTDLRVVYFNAWKYSGDSFRRQFLIETAKQIYEDHPDRDAKVLRLEQLNYTDVLRDEDTKGIVDQLRGLLKTEIRFRPQGLTRIGLAALFLIFGGILTFFDHSIYPLLASFFPAILMFLMNFKFEDLFLIQTNPVYDPRLIFPEQFEAEFQSLVSSDGPLGSGNAVIVIDDIDRCEPATVRDILVSIKTFLGHEKCFFIVPCDDKSIVQVFEDPNQKQGYDQELLRKYFNVGVRMAPLMGTDLVDFANNVSRQTGIPQGVVQLAILANCRDARKMKHFLNSLTVKYGIAKARKESGFMPVDIDKNLPGFAKAVLLEDLYPDLFAKLVEHPDIYDHLSRASLGQESADELKRFGLQNWQKAYSGLEDILKKTRDIKIENIEVFLSLKTTNPEARIPKGFELKNAIVQGDETAIQEIAKQITSDEAKTSLAELLTDLLNTTTDTFRKNTISATCNFYFESGLLPTTAKFNIAKAASQALLDDEGQQVLQQRAEFVLQCAKDADGRFISGLLRKYQKELAQLEQPPATLADIINALSRFTDGWESLASIVNKKLEDWSSNEKALQSLLQVHLPEQLGDDQTVPSMPVLEKIASEVSPDNTDSAVTLNDARKQLLFKNWRPTLAARLAPQLLAILQQGQQDSGYTNRIAFVVHAIIENAECIESGSAPQLWSHVQGLYTRTTDAEAKSDIYKAVLTFAGKSPEASTKQAAMNFALQTWRSFSVQALKENLKFIETFEGASGAELQKALVNQELTLAQNEVLTPTDRTKERLTFCYENREQLNANSLQDFLLKTLELQDPAFTVWSSVVLDFAGKFNNIFHGRTAAKALELAGGSVPQSKRIGLLRLFAGLLPSVQEDTKPQLLQKFFEFCKHSDPNIRVAAVAEIPLAKTAIEASEFRRGLNTLARDLFAKSTQEAAVYWPSIDAVIKECEMFGEYEWRDLGDLSKRLMEQADTALKDHGLSLVELMPELPKVHEEDLVQQLINIARGSANPQKDRAVKILEDLQISKLHPEAAKALKEYRKSGETEESKA
ncbi:MAG TPA: P-loop NTPase fold protein [Terriglobia bacterium]|nr:P-loop NTPase fold protein [Terriglobia bacterium]